MHLDLFIPIGVTGLIALVFALILGAIDDARSRRPPPQRSQTPRRGTRRLPR